MMPMDYWKAGLTAWNRIAQMQIETMRVGLDLMQGWQNLAVRPGLSSLRVMQPASVCTPARDIVVRLPGAVMALSVRRSAAAPAAQPEAPEGDVIDAVAVQPAAPAKAEAKPEPATVSLPAAEPAAAAEAGPARRKAAPRSAAAAPTRRRGSRTATASEAGAERSAEREPKATE